MSLHDKDFNPSKNPGVLNINLKTRNSFSKKKKNLSFGVDVRH